MVFSLVACGHFHQGDERLPCEARGRQCVPCCVMFFIVIKQGKSVRNFTSDDLDNILHCGSNIYCAMLDCKTVPQSGFVDPESLPSKILYEGKTVYIEHKGVLSGLIGINSKFQTSPAFSLEMACLQASTEAKYSIIVFSGVPVGIYCDMGCFYVFDSHSRSQNGTSCSDGKSVLGMLTTVTDLCAYLCTLVQSFGHDPTKEQYDIHFFALITYCKRQCPFGIKLLKNSYRIVTSTSKRKMLNTTVTTLSKRQHINSLLQGKSVLGCLDDRSVGDIETQIVSKFHKLVSVGPDYVCSCCTQTFFKHYVRNVSALPQHKQSLLKKFLTGIQSVDNTEWVCTGCFLAVQKGKIPKLWLHNGLQFPRKPAELEALSNL